MSDVKTDNIRLILSSAPHIRERSSINSIMWLVILSLMPATVYSVYLNGFAALKTILVCVGAAVLSEFAIRKALKRELTIQNGSAAITGLLLAFNLPPEVPAWLGAVGSVFAIVIVKELFGGLGFNIWNPALAARAFLMASWTTYMTTKWHHFSATNVLSGSVSNTGAIPQPAFDIITGATPLGSIKESAAKLADAGYNLAVTSGATAHVADATNAAASSAVNLYHVLFSPAMLKSLALGNVGGSLGETSAIFLLLGAILLLATRVITWHIPLSYLASFSAVIFSYYYFSGFSQPGYALLYNILAGGLILGAFFMATDMVTSPVTPKGMIIFGAGAGILAASIRLWGGYPEGVCYSILLMNTTVPLIDRYIKPRVYGTKRK